MVLLRFRWPLIALLCVLKSFQVLDYAFGEHCPTRLGDVGERGSATHLCFLSKWCPTRWHPKLKDRVLYFQDIISTLNRFWADQLLLLQPYDTEKGAGTMSPHTVPGQLALSRAVAYPNPAVAPPTGYGDNLNRAQHYFQYQVLIKPSPDGIQETYLASLEALASRPLTTTSVSSKTPGSPQPRRLGCGMGSVARRHGGDPVHLFQQCGGIDCKPVSIEITYGLESTMYLQDVERSGTS